jgi:NAD(P)H-quinone oxidoreductase subunit 4L
MWSKSNTIVVAFFAVVAVLTVSLAAGVFAQSFESIPIIASNPGIGVVGIILVMGAIAHLIGAELPPLMITGSLATFVALTYNQEDLIKYLTLAAMLFTVGMYGMTTSRNAVRVLMSIELMLNAVNINLVAFARYVDPSLVKGQLFAIFILAVAAAEAAVGLAIVLAIYRNSSTVDMEKFNLLKW